MCGIMFIVNSAVSQAPALQRGLMTDMLIASAVRGTDSTGMFQVDSEDSVFFGKTVEPSGAAVFSTELRGLINAVPSCPINVGHVRAATQGSVTEQNAHPFVAYKPGGEQYIIGVHNGTLYGWDYPRGAANGFSVDSEWALNEIAEKGTQAFSDFYGAFAFLWYDTSTPGILNIARNDERPLYLARTRDKATIIGASESGMLQWIAHRNKLELEDGVYSIDSGYLFTIDTLQDALTIEMVEELPSYSDYRMAPTTHTNITALVPTTPAPFADSTPTISYNKQRVLDRVKECLRLGRTSLLEKGDEQINYNDSVGDTLEELVFTAQEGWFDTAGILTADIKRSLYDGSYGSIVRFDPVDYDNVTNLVIGEIVAPEFFKQPLTYIQDVTPFEWAGIRDEDALPMVVVGLRYHAGEKEYIVVPLNQEGKEALAV